MFVAEQASTGYADGLNITKKLITQLRSSSFRGSVSSGGSFLDLAPLPFLPLAGLPLLARVAMGLFGLSCWLVDEVGRDLAVWRGDMNMY